MPTEHSHLLNSRACRKAAVKDKEAKAKAAKKKRPEVRGRDEGGEGEQVHDPLFFLPTSLHRVSAFDQSQKDL